MIFVAIALALSLMIGGGVSVAANDAQPGDALYEYKVHVNDRVAAGFEATAEGFENVRTTITDSFEAVVGADAEAEGDVESETDAESGEDSHSNINADGSIEADVDGSVEVGL